MLYRECKVKSVCDGAVGSKKRGMDPCAKVSWDRRDVWTSYWFLGRPGLRELKSPGFAWDEQSSLVSRRSPDVSMSVDLYMPVVSMTTCDL